MEMEDVRKGGVRYLVEGGIGVSSQERPAQRARHVVVKRRGYCERGRPRAADDKDYGGDPRPVDESHFF